MEKTKTKNSSLRLSSGQFLFFWILIGIAVMLLQRVITVGYTTLIDNWVEHIRLLSALAITFCAGIFSIFQQGLLERYAGIHIPHWWWLSAIAWGASSYVASELISPLTWTFGAGSLFGLTILVSVLIGLQLAIPGLVQAWLLRHNLRNTWIYAVGAILTGIAWGIFASVTGLNSISVLVFYAVVTGLVLVKLVSITSAEPRKNDQ